MVKKLPFHIVFWLFALNLCAFIIGYRSDWKQAYLLTSIYSPISIASAYFITHILMEKYLYSGRYIKFFVYLGYTVIASFFLIMILNTIVFINIANYQFGLMPTATRDIVVLFTALYLLVFLFVSTQSAKKYADIKIEKEAALKRMAESELKFLKSQLNPHFLFNTLNNLYSLSMQKSEQAPEAILKLSSLLDSILGASDNLLISIGEELKTMDDYIYLESLRFGDRLSITKAIEGKELTYHKIPPLTLITLLENCFKHGGSGRNRNLKIDISIHSDIDKVQIIIKNNFEQSSNSLKDGIGLKNLEKQLGHLFKEKHLLEIIPEEKEFTVKLNLEY